MVYVTHDQGEAMTMSDRIAVFNDGRIQQLDTAHGLYEAPQTSFVAQFIGENNRLPARVLGRDGMRLRACLHDGSTVTALAVNPGAEQTLLSIRPERAVIGPPETVGDNRFAARVEEVIYLGDHRRVRLSLGGIDGFIVKVPAGHAHGDRAPGAAVTVGWAWENCRALDA